MSMYVSSKAMHFSHPNAYIKTCYVKLEISRKRKMLIDIRVFVGSWQFCTHHALKNTNLYSSFCLSIIPYIYILTFMYIFFSLKVARVKILNCILTKLNKFYYMKILTVTCIFIIFVEYFKTISKL